MIPGGTQGTVYRNNDGRLMFVHGGIGGDDIYSTFWQAPNAKGTATSLHRLRTQPLRASAEEAQQDLDAVAARHRWAPIGNDTGKEEETMTETVPHYGSQPPAADQRREPGIPGGDSTRNSLDAPHVGNAVLWISPDCLLESADNPRGAIADDDPTIAELAESIRTHGVIEPLVAVAVQDANGCDCEFRLIAGHRRLAASRKAGLLLVPVVTRRVADDREALELMLVENLQRKDLNAIEEARGYAMLMELGHSQTTIGSRVHRSQEAISNTVRLLKLPEEVQGMIRAGALSASHGRALLRWEAVPKVITALAGYAAAGGVSARDLEGDLGWSLVNRLTADKLAAPLREITDPALKKVCGQCKRKCDSTCLDPACHAERKAEVERRNREKLQQAQAELQAAGKDDATIPVLSKLGWGTYNKLGCKLPTGCPGAACERAGKGIDYDKQVVAVCADVECWKRLQRADEKERKAAAGEYETARSAQVLACLQDANMDIRRALAVVVMEAMPSSTEQRHVKSAVADLGLDLDVEALYAGAWNPGGATRRRAIYEQLAAMDLHMLVALPALVRAYRTAHESGQWLSGHGSGEKLPENDIRYLLGEDVVEPRPYGEQDARPGEKDPDADDQDADAPCEHGVCRVCGCTDEEACELSDGSPCEWTDEEHTLCSGCVAAEAQAAEE